MSINQVTDISAALQLAAALAALWQIRRSGRRLAWSLIAAALLVMAGERLFTTSMASEVPAQFVHLHAVREWLQLVVAMLLLAGVWLIGGLFRRAQADAATARRSEERTRTILDNAPVGMFTFDTNLVITDCNRSLAEMIDIDCGRLVGFDLKALPDQRIPTILRETLQGRRRQGTGRYHSILSGRELFSMLVAVPERDEQGTVVGGIGFAVDLTHLEEVSEEVRRLALLVEQSPEAIWRLDPDWTIRWVNASVTRLLGYPPEELIGRPRRSLQPEQGIETYGDMVATVTAGSSWTGELTVRRNDGALLQIESLVFPLPGKDGETLGFVAFSRDVSERRRLEARMRQMEKMESVGQLAGGIAHDFNNVLTSIIATVDLLQLNKDRIDLDRSLNMIRDASTHAAKLTRQLLAFSRRQLLQPMDLDLNAVVEANLEMLRRLIGENIAIDVLPGRPVGTVHADPGQMAQVLMNLCANARDAMPAGGVITIETGNVVINGEFIVSHPWAAPGRYVMLSVSDTGKGMDEATLERVFEPFFTTKGPGRGTGLGLASVYGIVKQHEGLIHAYSEPGRGTTFKIYLPIVERCAAEIVEIHDGPLRGGSETLLLVEDDGDVREALAAGLAAQGYTLLTAEDGEVARSLLEERDWLIDLVISDTVMPRMGGMELLRAVVKRAPSLPFLLLSGYSEETALEGDALPTHVEFLQKPFGIDLLLRTIRRMLDAAAT